MIDEERGFRAALNADPTDLNALYAYAGWLEDARPTEPRIEGFRALVALGLQPWWFGASECWGFWDQYSVVKVPAYHLLPHDWLACVTINRHVRRGGTYGGNCIHTAISKPKDHNGLLLLRAVALAFKTMPTERQLGILLAEAV